ncbi:tetratricopeptide repeat protein [Cupriavidus metallidurans]|jgi:tetratricopeptide (TPR) repeat protein|uniref:Tetratricopeptide repeat protein n=2 Tax=Burkholderiaceae TaxID=119060 RepID=A0A482J2L0_9BURK|nr:tetratricopeptide repeat protein [Cupriavidus metallidurans]
MIPATIRAPRSSEMTPSLLAITERVTSQSMASTAQEAPRPGHDALGQVHTWLREGALLQAAHWIRDWLKRTPDSMDAIVAQAALHVELGDTASARTALEQVLATLPDHSRALAGMAHLALCAGDAKSAVDWFQQTGPEALDEAELSDWCEALAATGDLTRGADIARHLCERAPKAATSWFQLGLTLHHSGFHEQALDAYAKAHALDPDLDNLCNNIGAAYLQSGRTEEAMAPIGRAIELKPSNPLAWINLSDALLKLRRPDDAALAARRACALAPTMPLALQAQSNALKELGQWADALALMEKAAMQAPVSGGIIWNLAMLQMLHGDYRNGLINFEHRWASPELEGTFPDLKAPIWRGESLAGKTLFLWGEQGFGDAMQFVRFVPGIAELVRQQGGQLHYCCFSKLHTLFSRSLADVIPEVIPHDTPSLPRFDYHLPLCSAPLRLGTELDTLPADVPYLRADAAAASAWAQRLSASGKLNVGVVWSGSRGHQRNPLRAVPVAELAGALRDLPGIEFHSMQIDGVAELASVPDFDIRDHTAELRSYDDTAALISSLDLVITVCTSVAHLAGALGKPTWVMLDVNASWQWLLGRSDSPWYPTTRLYRQVTYRDWQPVLEQVRADLLGLAGGIPAADAN